MEIEQLKKSWKQKYGEIYSLTLEDNEYIFRTVSKLEFDKISQIANGDEMEMEEGVISEALLHPLPIDFNNISAGIITVLANQILTYSGLLVSQTQDGAVTDVLGEKIKHYYEKLNNVDHRVNVMISYAFKISIEEVEAMDVDRWAKYFTAAEFLLINLQGVPPEAIDFVVRPEEIKKKGNKAMQARAKAAALNAMMGKPINATDIDPSIPTPQNIKAKPESKVNPQSPAADLPPWLRSGA